MILEDRKAKILNAAIESFITRGEPVSSQWLYDHYRFGIKPAMIRHELEALTEEGYLMQPYHSAGRIPADKGFELFAHWTLEAESPPQIDKELHTLLEDKAWEPFLKELADELGVLGVLGNERGEVAKKGLECLVEHFAWETPEEIQRLVRDFVELDERVGAIIEEWTGDPLQIFIGRRSPVTRSEGLAVVMGKYQIPDGEVVVCTIGPKRMNYRRVIQVMKSIGEIHNDD
ncbi:MAG: hypothetical protein FJY98_02615 [Candidatus Liptonbacteria bacterium]|nr:hypothetical protein [Candidatus Liptonbacteria bacterium]